jgi:hypothetical protein
MPFSVALNQPQFDNDDLGFDFSSLIAPLINTAISAGGAFLSSKFSADAIKSQIATQTQAAKDLSAYKAQQDIAVAQAQSAVPLTSSPYFLPALGIGAVALLLFLRK